MGFGGSPDEISNLTRRSREAAVDRLLNFEQVDNQELEDTLNKSLNPKKFTPRDDLQLWWIVRMILTQRPFEEKMTLFWHNHFATALDKVPYPLMYVQNQMLRQNSLERFDTLLLNVAQDPGMLVYLDGVTNKLGHANENFGRELEELFTMGINDVVTGQPNYTERDVKEIARAFTGWQFKERGHKPYKYTFFIQADQHDNAAKTIYGQTANFGGEDVISLISARRSTARFLVKKIFEFFVYPLTNSSEDHATVEKFADVYVNNNHSIKSLVGAIFLSDEFFSDRAQFALVKSPAELIVGTLRMLSARYNPGSLEYGDFDLYNQFKRMGFDILNPFDVSGWKLNLGWLSTATVLERYNFATNFIETRDADKHTLGGSITNDQLRSYADANATTTVRNFARLLGPLNLDPQTINALADYLQTDDDGHRMTWSINDDSVNKNLRGLVFLLMCSPEYQMN